MLSSPCRSWPPVLTRDIYSELIRTIATVRQRHWSPSTHWRLINQIIIRPPYIVVGGLIFYRDSFFLSSFFVRYTLSSLNGTQLKSATCSEVGAIWKGMSKIWGIPSPTNRGPQNHLFRWLRDSTATLTAYIFRTKHDIDNIGQMHWQLQRVSYMVSKRHELWSPNGFKLDRHFTHLCKFCFLCHCQASQTDTSKRNSTKLCHTADGKSR